MTDTTKNPDYKVRYESRDENYTVGIAKQAKRDISKISAAVSAEAHDLSQLYGFDQVIRGAEGPYRPDDGAAAFARALVRVFNTDGVGQVTRSFFGDTPPIYKDIQVQELIYRTGDLREITADSLLNIEVWPITELVNFAISEGVTVISPYSEGDRYPIIGELTDRWEIVGTKIGTAQVPVGKVELGEYGLICDVGSKMEEPWGEVFWLKIVAPKMQTEVVNELRDAVQDELAKRSIYKGRCLYTSNTGTPAFWDPFRATRRAELILPQVLQSRIDHEVHGVLNNMSAARKWDASLVSRKWVFEGDFGTGKTQAMNIAAQVAMQNGITVVRHKPGDQLEDTQRMAALHAPSLIQIEDVETYMPDKHDPDYDAKASKILEEFDGGLSKGREVMTVMTTNNPLSFIGGMTRTGRVDGLFTFHSIDRPGLEQLIKLKLGDRVDPKVDYDAVWDVCGDMTSSFLSEIPKRSTVYLLSRPGEKFNTDDLVNIVSGLRAQYEWHEAVKLAESSEREPTFRQVHSEIVRSVVVEELNKTTAEIPGVGVAPLVVGSK